MSVEEKWIRSATLRLKKRPDESSRKKHLGKTFVSLFTCFEFRCATLFELSSLFAERDGKQFISRLYIGHGTVDMTSLAFNAKKAHDDLAKASSERTLTKKERSKFRESTEFSQFKLVSVAKLRECAAVYARGSDGGKKESTLVVLDGVGILSPSFCLLVHSIPEQAWAKR
jgi:hypothetical protein